MRLDGQIVSWNNDKGYGFVQPDNGGKNIFLHIKECDWKPVIGQEISFSLGKDKNGRVCGKTAVLKGVIHNYERTSVFTFFQSFFGLFSLVGIFLISYFYQIDIFIPIIFFGMSLITYFFYWLDKNAAEAGNWRTPESTLHFLSLFGGWPGALIAQQRLNHKTRKQPFRFIFFLTLLINVGLVLFLVMNETIKDIFY